MYRSLVSRAVKGDMRAAALVTKLAAQLGLSSPSGDDDEIIIVRVPPFGDGDPLIQTVMARPRSGRNRA